MNRPADKIPSGKLPLDLRALRIARLGHPSATKCLKAAGGKDGMNVPPAVLRSERTGRHYIAAVELAGRYATPGENGSASAQQIIGGSVTDMCTITLITVGANGTVTVISPPSPMER
jgi:hypothetical protein